MSKSKEYIWYASYGSNLNEERFLCYIKGGQAKGSSKLLTGCNDKTHPIDNDEIYICSELYFAQQSSNWDNGGVAFINSDFDEKFQTLGRKYLITTEQFIEIVKQENNYIGELSINFDLVIADGSYIFKENAWYGKIVFLGYSHDQPIFTFTNQNQIARSSRPSENYLLTIITGLLETHTYLNNTEIVKYLISKRGITNNYSKEELDELIKSIKI